MTSPKYAFATTINGHGSGTMRPDVAAHVREIIGRMDGAALFAITLWSYPAGTDFEDVDVNANSQEYIQCAGDASRLVIEIRRREGASFVQYAVGRASGSPKTQYTEIAWDHGRRRERVPAREVFEADEAGRIFETYINTGAAPEVYTLRPLTVV